MRHQDGAICQRVAAIAAFAVFVGFGLCIAASHAASSSTEAPRYVNAQGIEIIHNRAAIPKAGEPASAAMARVTGASSPAAALQREQRATVSAKDQGDRDKDRLMILRQELSTETTRYQSAMNTLGQPGAKERLGEAEWQRLRYTLGLHEENIKALNAEIGRTQSASR